MEWKLYSLDERRINHLHGMTTPCFSPSHGLLMHLTTLFTMSAAQCVIELSRILSQPGFEESTSGSDGNLNM